MDIVLVLIVSLKQPHQVILPILNQARIHKKLQILPSGTDNLKIDSRQEGNGLLKGRNKRVGYEILLGVIARQGLYSYFADFGFWDDRL